MDRSGSEDLSSRELVAAIRDKSISAVEVIEAALDRAERLKDLNSIIHLSPDTAIARAQKVARGKIDGPLAGLPIVVKDNINTADMPTSGGTSALRHARPTENEPSVQRLLDAGAIVVGKANMHELSLGVTSTNCSAFAGPVKNPYDSARIPGGSSGGTAAAIASRIVSCGIGSDTGGSTRIPAALTGIVGFRPSVGNGGAQRRYDDRGLMIPIDRDRDTVGPMGRSVVDVALLDSIITGRPMVASGSLAGCRLGIPASFWRDLDPPLEEMALVARTKLERAGIDFAEVDSVGLFEQNRIVSTPLAPCALLEEIAAYLEVSGISDVTVQEIVESIASPDVKRAFDAIAADDKPIAENGAARAHRTMLQSIFESYFKRNCLDGILFPTTPTTAPLIDLANGSGEISIAGKKAIRTFDALTRNVDPGSNAGIPGLSLFGGMAKGLPLGLELEGPVGSDERLLSLGLSIEKVLGVAPKPEILTRPIPQTFNC